MELLLKCIGRNCKIKVLNPILKSNDTPAMYCVIYIVLRDDIYNIFKRNSYENVRTYFKNLGGLNLL